MIAFFTDRRVAIGAIIYVIGAIIMCIYPQNARFILAGTNMLAILTVLYIWAKHDKPITPTSSTNQA